MNESIVVMCMGGIGHMQILLPLISGLRSRGCAVHVLTHADFKAKVEAAGAHFVDLFEHHPLDAPGRHAPSAGGSGAAAFRIEALGG